ncbi:MAG: GldG family protein [Treponemataceae bacterium]|nr:GldG family protein [Treponemataceae bacterium]
MRRWIALYRAALFAYLIDPLFYLASLVTVLFSAVRFFFVGRFFLMGTGTTDLRAFFTGVPYVSAVIVPLLVLRLRALLGDDSLPVSPTARCSALTAAAFSAFAVPLVLLAAIPLCVSQFGSVDAGQVAAGFLGILLYALAACALAVLCFARFFPSAAVSVAVSALALAAVSVLHFVPLYFPVGNAVASFCRAAGFAWHLDAAGKGMVDSRDGAFFLLVAFSAVMLAARAEFRRTGRKGSALTSFLLVLTVGFSAVAFSRLSVRADLTAARRFSLSAATRTLVRELESPLRITYYRSPELKRLYPQSADVAEYLTTYCAQSPLLTLRFEKPDGDRLNALGVQGQQIRTDTGTKTEFVTVYSAVLLQYRDQQTLIPFVLTADTLEYDLTRRVQDLVTRRQKKVLLAAGNGRSIPADYGYVEPWLNALGFMTEVIEPGQIAETAQAADPGTALVVFGSSALTREESAAIERAVFGGMPAVIATSPYSVALEDDWTVTKNRADTLVPALNSWGFAFAPALANDIANVPLMLQSADADALQYTINYPLWLSLLPQESTKRGLTLFWASPLVLYENAQPLLVTTPYAWTQAESTDAAHAFLTNAFTVPKSAREAGGESARLTVGAYCDGEIAGYYETGSARARVAVIADQYCAHTGMTAFTASEQGADFRNYDFLALTVLRLRGDDALAALLDKAGANTTLWKTADPETFAAARNWTLFVLFVLLPLLIGALAIATKTVRARYNRGEA